MIHFHQGVQYSDGPCARQLLFDHAYTLEEQASSITIKVGRCCLQQCQCLGLRWPLRSGIRTSSETCGAGVGVRNRPN